MEDIKAGTDEPLSSSPIFIINAAVIPQWGTMRHRCVSCFVLCGYYRFFSFSAQPTHKLCPCGRYGDERKRRWTYQHRCPTLCLHLKQVTLIDLFTYVNYSSLKKNMCFFSINVSRGSPIC